MAIVALGHRLKIVEFCSFYVAGILRRQPVAVGLLLLMALGAGATAVAWAYEAARHEAAWTALQASRRPALPVAMPAAHGPAVGADLPVFSSASFTAEFLSIAHEAGVPTEEVAYALENGVAQPYARYRITLEAKSGYPELRKFIAALESAQPNVALDAIRCRRDDAGASTLACQLAFSAFFRKASHG